MHEMRRRDFLRYGAGSGLALMSSRLLTGCGAPMPYIPVPTDRPWDDDAEVAAVRGTDLYNMTRAVLETVGGIDSIIHPGETVFIKPNLGGLDFMPQNVFTTGESAKVEIIAVVAEECLKAGAGKVIIGEGGQIPTFSWENAVTLDGSTNLATEARRLDAAYPGRITLVCLEAESPTWDAIPSPRTDLGHIYVSSHVTQADRVISIAPLKSHRWTYLTGAMKNFVGTASLKRHSTIPFSRSRLHSAAGGVTQCFLDIVHTVQPDLAIIDGSIGCEGNGPHVAPFWGKTVDIRDRLGEWFLLAGTDAAAVDATAARIIGLDPEAVPCLQQAYEQGIGQIYQERITLRGVRLDDLKMDWLLADHTAGFDQAFLPTILTGLAKLVGIW
ncbi:MAG: DUF362 domain-containing protein [Phycisphaerales bacterium]|nr:DUF362 domain-containing protein [Phycisphaerales bacterium]